MNDLLTAAKAVIEMWDQSPPIEHCQRRATLRAAVERAEKPPADFMGWWKTFPLNTYGIVPAFHGWEAGQQAERERIRSRVQIAAEKTWPAGDWYVGPQNNNIGAFVEELLRDDDN